MTEIQGVKSDMIANNLIPAHSTHPGEILKEEIECRGLSQKGLAQNMGMSYKALNDILNARRPLSTDTALLFESALGISAKMLMAMQLDYNINKAKSDKTFSDRLVAIRKMAASWLLSFALVFILFPS